MVIGIGATPESTEKQAITDAVRQAVGSCVDANTIVENEVVSPARQHDHGLYKVDNAARGKICDRPRVEPECSTSGIA